MNNGRMIKRLGVVAVLVGLLAIATAAPAFPAQPEAGNITTGSASVWLGHNCPASVPVSISNLSAGLGGYETKVSWPAGRFSSNAADVNINIGTYLTNGGTRQQTGDSGTPPLKAVTTDAVKFGAYSWGTNNPPGNQAAGQLATVGLKPTATCGPAALTLAETQLVDINGSVIPLSAQTGSTANVYSQWDASGSSGNVDAGDIVAVINNLGRDAGLAGSCGSSYYRYDTDLSGGNINAGDIIAVINHLGTSCP